MLKDNMQKELFKMLCIFFLPLTIIPLEIYYFKNSNVEVAMMSALYILIVSACYLLGEASEVSGARRHVIGIGTLLLLYGLYGVHSMFVLQVFSAVILFCFMVAVIVLIVSIVVEKRANTVRVAYLQTVYPLEEKTLTSKEKEMLSSLYGKNGHYYKVIQSGKIEKEEAEAINAKIRRELKVKP